MPLRGQISAQCDASRGAQMANHGAHERPLGHQSGPMATARTQGTQGVGRQRPGPFGSGQAPPRADHRPRRAISSRHRPGRCSWFFSTQVLCAVWRLLELRTRFFVGCHLPPPSPHPACAVYRAQSPRIFFFNPPPPQDPAQLTYRSPLQPPFLSPGQKKAQKHA